LNAQAGTPQRSGLVSKYDLSFQQFIGEFFGSYRLIEEPRGWLDLLGGRFTYLGDKVGLQANNMAIDAASSQLVDHFAQQLATPSSDLRTLVARVLDGHNPKLPVGPIAADQKDKIGDSVQQLLASKQQELADAIRAGDQARVNQLKGERSSRVAKSVTRPLNRSFSPYDSWADPVIGLRGRLNLSKGVLPHRRKRCWRVRNRIRHSRAGLRRIRLPNYP
jgi:hypothetical protein